MDALDLTHTPPRSPRAELAGLTFLPRTIDKIRATLPGGNLGDYTITGFTTRMLEQIKISVDELTVAVRDAASEDAVGAYVTSHTDPADIRKWNDFVLNRQILRGDRADAIAEYPYLADRPDLVYALDFLEDDDKRSFAKA